MKASRKYEQISRSTSSHRYRRAVKRLANRSFRRMEKRSPEDAPTKNIYRGFAE